MTIEGIVDTDFVNQQVAATEQYAGSTESGEFDSSMFLNILMEQLKNQSPYDTTDSSEILEQQAILTEVEQAVKTAEATEDLNETMTSEIVGLKDSIAEINATLNTIAQQLADNGGDE